MIQVRPFAPGDLALINSRPYERELIAATGRDFGEQFALGGPAYTMLEDDAPIATAGVYILWAGVGEAWMHLSLYATEHRPLALYRWTDRMLAAIIKDHRLRRVQAPICRSMLANRRFIESLGFIPEGTMHRWGPDDRDYTMYARVAYDKEGLCLRQPL